jgi:hypothetical protein
MRLFTKNNEDYSLGFTFKMLTTFFDPLFTLILWNASFTESGASSMTSNLEKGSRKSKNDY